MRHRQNSGAGTSGGRPSILAFTFLCGSAAPAVLAHDSAGLWTAYGLAAFGAAVGVCSLWARRGLMERRIEEMAGRRRSDLALAGEAQQRHRAEIERMRAELENEQQYTGVLQDQLIRLRAAVEQERRLRLTAERQVDTAARALAGAHLGAVPDDPALLDLPAPDADVDADFSEELLYRPFIEMAAVESPLSPAALAMAPVLGPDDGAEDEDDVLDLIAYDQTVEFSVRALRGERSA